MPESREPVSILAAAAAIAARESDIDGAIDALVRLVRDGVASTDAVVFLQDPDQAELQIAGRAGLEADTASALAAAATDPTNLVAEAIRDQRTTSPDGQLCVPLRVQTVGVDLVLGALLVRWSGGAAPDRETSSLVSALADLLAVTVDRARLASTAAERSDWFERMAHTDPLTGLANERTVARILELELARAGRQNSDVSIVLFDVDDFQATNRDGGFAAGDDVLRRVAAVLAESVRLVDTVGRIGGDEFVLVAPGSAGMTVARRVLEGIVSLPPVAGRPITVSAGVAQFPADGTDADALIEAAKTALERARADGRGRAVPT